MSGQYIFVGANPDGHELSRRRSHAARISYQKRAQNLTQHLPGGFRSGVLAPQPSRRVLPRKDTQVTVGEQVGLDSRIPPIVQQPRTPLVFGSSASPSANLEGHKYVCWQLSNAVNKSALVYPAFRLSSIATHDWLEILTHQLVFHASAAYLQAAFDGNNAPSKETLVHRGKALEAIRLHIGDVGSGQQKLNSNAVFAIATLACLEENLGNHAAHRMHRKTLGKMVAAKGGFQNLAYDARYSAVCEMEMVWSLRSGYTVIPYNTSSSRRKRNRGDGLPPVKISDVSVLPLGFQLLDADNKISSDLVRTVAYVAKGLRGDRETDGSGTAIRRHKWYWDAFPCLHISYAQVPTLEELIELAVLEFCSHTIMPKSPGLRSHVASRLRLTEYLPTFAAARTEMSDSEVRVVFWMWMLTLYAWEVPVKDAKQDGAERLGRFPLMEFLNMNGEEVEGLLKGFFWTEDLVDFGRKRWNLWCE